MISEGEQRLNRIFKGYPFVAHHDAKAQRCSAILHGELSFPEIVQTPSVSTSMGQMAGDGAMPCHRGSVRRRLLFSL